MARPEPELDPAGVVYAGLKQLLTRLSEAELMLIRSWVEHEIRTLANTPRSLRLVRSPGARTATPEPPPFEGNVVELMGALRRRLHELPEDRLIVLHVWINDRLRQGYRHRE